MDKNTLEEIRQTAKKLASYENQGCAAIEYASEVGMRLGDDGIKDTLVRMLIVLIGGEDASEGIDDSSWLDDDVVTAERVADRFRELADEMCPCLCPDCAAAGAAACETPGPKQTLN